MIRIADTFTDSLARLTRDEQKAVKTTAFDLQANPANPGHQFHKLDRGKDRNFWSVRVSADIRIIVHRTGDSILLCYVGHHDAAYEWAERRKLDVHPTTGAAQFVVVRERLVEIPMRASIPAPAVHAAPPILATQSRDTLLGYGVPAEWIDEVLAATEDSLLGVAEQLPQEAAEAVLALATGSTPVKYAWAALPGSPFEHPDAQRRFRVMHDVEELERALAEPWEKWTVFLHPAQREIVGRRFGGPARVAGTAGTGKTVVALHRAVHLARENPQGQVLVATFSVTLARVLRQKLRFLVGDDAGLRGRITVDTVDDAARTLFEQNHGRARVATSAMVESLLREISAQVGGHSVSDRFVFGEWQSVVDEWQLTTWEEYRDVPRLGRKTRLGEKQRAVLWKIFQGVRERLEAGALHTPAMILAEATRDAVDSGSPFCAVVVDEAQDIGVAQLRFVAALGGARPDGLFFAGDLGQRIFQTPFSWKALGVDVRGRSQTLRVNYRTSHQIRSQADLLLDPEIADVDGVVESRRGAVSVFNGPAPEVIRYGTEREEIDGVGVWIRARVAEGVPANEVAVFVRSEGTVDRARRAIEVAGHKSTTPAPGADAEPGRIVLLPMHMAKGLEFRAVVVMGCDVDELPLQSRIEAVADDSDLDEVYESERHLLYVACTRARDRLLVTGVEPGSEFLGDLEASGAARRGANR